MNKIKYKKQEILKYVGDISQVFGVKEYCLKGGKAEGVRAIDVKNGQGLEFTILPDRGMDFAWLSYKGINLSYLSSNGIVAPYYYNERGTEFLRNFFAGFLTTCGLRNVGTPCSENDEKFGLHGRISNIPAEEVCATVEWHDELPVIRIKGKIRETKFLGENIILSREVVCKPGSDIIYIHDVVENYGFRVQPLMILYHFNFGYPFLDANTKLITDVKNTVPRDEISQNGLDRCFSFQKPSNGCNEQVFYHELNSDEVGNISVKLINPILNIEVIMKFNKTQLKRLTQWKSLNFGEYVLGLEPCNCFVEGIKAEKEKGSLEYILPGEVKEFDFAIEFNNYFIQK